MIRANPETSKVPVIVLTSSDDAPDIEEARKLGADHYTVKPIDFAKVVQVAKVLGFRWALLPTIENCIS
jgi:two-component system response regulator